MPINTAPSGNFLSRFGGMMRDATNLAAQQYGGPFKGTAKLTGGIGARMRNKQQPRATMPPADNPISPTIPPPGIVQGPSMGLPFMKPGDFGGQPVPTFPPMGGALGPINPMMGGPMGGMNPDMGGGGYDTGLWGAYNQLKRPVMGGMNRMMPPPMFNQ
jgi:hypothetical protein